MTTETPSRSPDLQFRAALVNFQAQIKTIELNSENPHFKSKYADLAAVWDTIRKPLAENGLAITQQVQRDGTYTFLRTTLLHVGGEQLFNDVPLLVSKNDMQGLGSAITYARRYGLMPLIGAVAGGEDDDGEAAKGHQNQKQNNGKQNGPVRGDAGKPGENQKPPAAPDDLNKPNNKQLARLFAIASSSGWEKEDVANFLKTKLNKTSSRELTMDEYNKLCDYIGKNKKLDPRAKAAGEGSEAPPIEADPEGDPTIGGEMPPPPGLNGDDIPW